MRTALVYLKTPEIFSQVRTSAGPTPNVRTFSPFSTCDPKRPSAYENMLYSRTSTHRRRRRDSTRQLRRVAVGGVYLVLHDTLDVRHTG